MNAGWRVGTVNLHENGFDLKDASPNYSSNKIAALSGASFDCGLRGAMAPRSALRSGRHPY